MEAERIPPAATTVNSDDEGSVGEITEARPRFTATAENETGYSNAFWTCRDLKNTWYRRGGAVRPRDISGQRADSGIFVLVSCQRWIESRTATALSTARGPLEEHISAPWPATLADKGLPMPGKP